MKSIETPKISIKQSRPARLTNRSKILKTIVQAIEEKKGDNIIALDLRNIEESVTDFFIVCEASSAPQLRAIGDNIQNNVSLICGENPYHTEGYHSAQWILIDYVNIVAHIMLPDIRKFYALEEMWSDAPTTTFE